MNTALSVVAVAVSFVSPKNKTGMAHNKIVTRTQKTRPTHDRRTGQLKNPLSKGLSITMVHENNYVLQAPQKSEHFPPLNLAPRHLLTIKTCTQCKHENAFHYHLDPVCVACALSITEGN